MAELTARQLTELIADMRVAPGAKVELARDFDPGFRAGWATKSDGERPLQLSVQLLAEYQDRLAAQDTHGLLVVLQGIDASGKDGTVRHVMSGVNPQGVVVHSFKVPSEEERGHDYLWRSQRRLPARGQIAIFNRSHYEEVVVTRVHPELLDAEHLPSAARGEDLWRRRFREINDWERYLVDNGFRVVKLLLNLSREEQRKRLLERIDRPEKNWKFSASDVQERAYWDDYQHAFSEMLSHTSTDWAPWYVIPADHKWFARIAVGTVLVQTLMDIDPHYPTISDDARRELLAAREQLGAESGEGRDGQPVQ
jgi:PPK2 family polyphosphate:nucleotide phosphotransferase